MAKIKKEYRICDRCEEKINERWYKLTDLTRFKKRVFVSGYAIDRDYDLCGKCTEKFDRFMDGTLDDDIPTEYEEYHKGREKHDNSTN